MEDKPQVYGTGLSGLVGSRIVELLKKDFDFINLDLTEGIDITDKNQVLKAIKSNKSAKALIHLAAFTDVSQAYDQQGDKTGSVYQVNVVGTQNLAQACKKRGLYLIHISTDFIFDGKKHTPYTETDQPNPIEWYGQTKFLAEKKVKASGANHAIIRIAFPFRSHFPQKLDLVRTIFNKLKDNSLHPMFTDQIITPTFIDDIVKVLKVFILKTPTGVYHVVGSTSLSPYELAQKINLTFNLKADIKKGSFKDYLKKDPRPRQQYLKLSNVKLKKDLGLSMSTLDSALQKLKSQIS